MRKMVKTVVSGKGRKAARARRLYKEIESGAGAQQRLQTIYEKHFFDPKFDSGRFVEEAAKLGGSKRQKAELPQHAKGLERKRAWLLQRQNIELKEYAKRLARKREWALQRFKAWGIEPEHMGNPMEKTPSGVSAKTLLCNMADWHSLSGKVKMVPSKNMLAFLLEPGEYRRIVGKEQPKTKAAKVLVIGEKNTLIVITESLERIRKYFEHEKNHAMTANLPIYRELYLDSKRKFSPKTLRQSFVSRDLKLGTRKLGREMLDELIANMVEGELGFFEKKYEHYYLPDYSRDYLGPKTATAFMHNKGKHKSRILKAAAESIKAVKKALAATVADSQGRKRKIVSREELAGLLANIRDIEKVPKRLPVLVELRKKRIEGRRK